MDDFMRLNPSEALGEGLSKAIDTAVEPAHCWNGHCPVAGDANPS